MPTLKRSSFVTFTIEDQTVLDIAAFLRGDIRVTPEVQLFAYSPLTASRHRITLRELGLLAQIPTHWCDRALLAKELEVDASELDALRDRGWLLSDADETTDVGEEVKTAELRRREALLSAEEWHPMAALYHFLTRGPDLHAETEVPEVDVEDLALLARESAAEHIARWGKPPAAFHQRPDAQKEIALPPPEKNSCLDELLLRRQTVRTFDTSRCLTLEQLTNLLFSVFGCQGTTRFHPDLISLRKSSPSGGSLHPIEAYPLILRVEGLPPGLYHYAVQHHSLELLSSLSLSEAESLAVQMAAGQGYLRSAHVVIAMTARFYRSFWKYRKSLRTYGVLLMDAAHLSQTFYLVATELDLGVFFTATINAPRIEQALGVDGFAEGALALCGCGLKRPDNSSLALERQPFTPGKPGQEL